MEIGETDPRSSLEAGGLFSNMAGFYTLWVPPSWIFNSPPDWSIMSRVFRCAILDMQISKSSSLIDREPFLMICTALWLVVPPY